MEREKLSQDMQDLNRGSRAYQAGDYETAIRYYKLAAGAGNVTAISNLGYCYYYGRSIPVDKENARKCWEKAAIFGDIAAIYKLGDMYRNGDLKTNLEFSHALYKRAFELAVDSDDVWVYPDAYLRMLKYYPEEARTSYQTTLDIAEECVRTIEQRITEGGDRLSDRVLRDAKKVAAQLYQKRANELMDMLTHENQE